MLITSLLIYHSVAFSCFSPHVHMPSNTLLIGFTSAVDGTQQNDFRTQKNRTDGCSPAAGRPELRSHIHTHTVMISEKSKLCHILEHITSQESDDTGPLRRLTAAWFSFLRVVVEVLTSTSFKWQREAEYRAGPLHHWSLWTSVNSEHVYLKVFKSPLRNVMRL